jgi:hypothetical protein
MKVKMISKGNIFHNEDESDSAKRSSGTQKVKFDIDFLGCVECSTNGDLLGERRIYVPPSGSTDAKAGGELNWFLNQSLFLPLHLKFSG